MRELVIPKTLNAECFIVNSGGSDGPTSSRKAWLGGGSSTQRLGSITAMDLDTNTVTAQVPEPQEETPQECRGQTDSLEFVFAHLIFLFLSNRRLTAAPSCVL